MKDNIKLYIITLLFRAVQQLPLSTENVQQLTIEPELQSELFEGDMILNAEQEQLMMTNTSGIRNFMKASPRNGLISDKYLWPHKVVLYRISSEFTQSQAAYIEQAMLHIASRTCLRFRPAPPDGRTYVYIGGSNNAGCYSSVGYQGRLQFINLQRSPGCLRLGSIVHELMHTIGFYHEQSAPNRDLYVRILLENIHFGKEHNFAKYPLGQVSSYGLGYDYGSVMHYGSKAFTKNGLDTIVAIYGNMVIGQRAGLSEKDVHKIRKMYEC